MSNLILPTLEQLKAGTALLINKPYRWTSFDVVHKLRKPIQTKVGHAGTLDPLATGLLICCTGPFTKKITEFQMLPKVYTGIFHLGAQTPTYDLESQPEQFKDYTQFSHQDIINACKPFIGDILQIPPAHSAIKKDGQRAYSLARAGKEVQLDPRPIHISAFEITAIEGPEVHFSVSCSTGTYIRSLAHDFGQALGCGAYLKKLVRTQIGSYSLEQAFELDQLINHLKTNV